MVDTPAVAQAQATARTLYVHYWTGERRSTLETLLCQGAPDDASAWVVLVTVLRNGKCTLAPSSPAELLQPDAGGFEDVTLSIDGSVQARGMQRCLAAAAIACGKCIEERRACVCAVVDVEQAHGDGVVRVVSLWMDDVS